MSEKMKVATMDGIGKISIREAEKPVPKAGEVLVKLEYVGICGSDMHYFEEGRIGSHIVEPPFVLGHEPGGVVVALGEGVSTLKIGDKVALEPGKTCGKCKFCKEGLYNLCNEVVFFGSPPVGGVFGEYVAHEEGLCFKLPNTVSTLEGALVEPLAVGLHAAKQGEVQTGQTAIVFGSGCIGLVSMMALKFLGAKKVYVVDVVEKRLNKALQLGADGVINAKTDDVLKKCYEIMPQGFDLAIDTSGSEIAINQCLEVLRKGANVVLVGYSKTGKINLNASIAMNKELCFKTVFRYRHLYPLAISAIEDNKVNLKDLATHIFDFDDIENAMNRSINEKEEIVKAVIKLV